MRVVAIAEQERDRRHLLHPKVLTETQMLTAPEPENSEGEDDRAKDLLGGLALPLDSFKYS